MPSSKNGGLHLGTNNGKQRYVSTLDQRVGMTQIGSEDTARYEVKSDICRCLLSRSEAQSF